MLDVKWRLQVRHGNDQFSYMLDLICHMFFRHESVHSQLEKVLNILKDRIVEEQQTSGQPFKEGFVHQTTPHARFVEEGQALEIAQNEDVSSLSDRSVLQDSFLDSGMSHY